ncbi:DNA polymerase III subunit delta [Metamycoplasma spumans]|uniref:DNA polymerase III subunit delta n=1 Tax=Metamycoplasma spumans TaxID=92406 RepID=UPI0034DD354E
MILITGNENYFIKKEIEKIIKEIENKNSINLEIITFYDDVDLEQLSDTLFDNDIFSEQKLIIINNPIFFNSKNKYKKEEAIKFQNLIVEGDIYNHIIISQEIQKYDKTFVASDIFKKMKSESKVIEVEKINDKDMYKFVNSLIKERGATIDDLALIKFVSSMPNDLFLIEREIEKLLLLNNSITEKNIDDNNFSMSNNIEFALSDALLKFNSSSDIIKKINEQISFGQSNSQVIAQIASIISQAKDINILLNLGLNAQAISDEISMHIYRVKIFIDFIRKISENKLNNLIKVIAKYDEDLKKGLIEDSNALKSILLEIIK